jgi:hypothetical protein
MVAGLSAAQPASDSWCRCRRVSMVPTAMLAESGRAAVLRASMARRPLSCVGRVVGSAAGRSQIHGVDGGSGRRLQSVCARNGRAKPPTKCNDLRPGYDQMCQVASRYASRNYVDLSGLSKLRRLHPKSSASANSATLAYIAVMLVSLRERIGVPARASGSRPSNSGQWRTGNAPVIAPKHYLQVPTEHFREGVG